MVGGGAAGPPQTTPPDPPRAPGRADATTAISAQPIAPPTIHPPAHEEDHGDVARLSSLREIVAELDVRREIALKYEIERYVRPAEIDFGHFRYTAAPNAPANLSQRIKDWLEDVTGVEWEVFQSNDGAAESVKERRTRRGAEKLQAAASIPRIAEALSLFPGAQVLRVEDADQADDLDDLDPQHNVIHVDFGLRERAEEVLPDPEEREDDE